MTRATIVGGVFVLGLVLLGLAGGHWALERYVGQAAGRAVGPAVPTSTARTSAAAAHPALLYGRVTARDGTEYEGRLRFGGAEEVLWNHTFNGVKAGNPWAAHVPPERLPTERVPIEIFGFRIAERQRPMDLGRPFMVRFGNVRRIDAPSWWDLRVTLKSGAVVELDRFEADDFADGVRVWDPGHGVVDLGERQIRSIELFSPTQPDSAQRDSDQHSTASQPLHGAMLFGTVHTRQGSFTGFLQWNREKSLGSDTLDGHTEDGEHHLRFDTLRTIARHSPDSSRVTLRDGRELVLSGTREAGRGHRGIYVDDPRYGRVLVSWDAFERVELHGGDGAPAAPAYDDFPPGSPLIGSVTLRDGRRLAGRLVFDLDESETTETLDAPAEGVDYTIPFGRIAAITPVGSPERGVERTRVVLHNGEELHLEPAGDLGDGNAGMLVFIDGREGPEYVPWSEVEAIALDRLPTVRVPGGLG